MQEDILEDIRKERMRQVDKWGVQSHPDVSSDYFSHASFPRTASSMRWLNDKRAEHNKIAWDGILYEELMEAFEEMGLSQQDLRKELIECAAVIVAWIEDIDSRSKF